MEGSASVSLKGPRVQIHLFSRCLKSGQSALRQERRYYGLKRVYFASCKSYVKNCMHLNAARCLPAYVSASCYPVAATVVPKPDD